MITHDAAAGTGGIDASLWFEVNRPENFGRDFNETYTNFRHLYSPKVSAADLLAISVVTAHSFCGGTTKIPFRYGRVDAQSPGQAGVPEMVESGRTGTTGGFGGLVQLRGFPPVVFRLDRRRPDVGGVSIPLGTAWRLGQRPEQCRGRIRIGRDEAPGLEPLKPYDQVGAIG